MKVTQITIALVALCITHAFAANVTERSLSGDGPVPRSGGADTCSESDSFDDWMKPKQKRQPSGGKKKLRLKMPRVMQKLKSDVDKQRDISRENKLERARKLVEAAKRNELTSLGDGLWATVYSSVDDLDQLIHREGYAIVRTQSNQKLQYHARFHVRKICLGGKVFYDPNSQIYRKDKRYYFAAYDYHDRDFSVPSAEIEYFAPKSETVCKAGSKDKIHTGVFVAFQFEEPGTNIPYNRGMVVDAVNGRRGYFKVRRYPRPRLVVNRFDKTKIMKAQDGMQTVVEVYHGNDLLPVKQAGRDDRRDYNKKRLEQMIELKDAMNLLDRFEPGYFGKREKYPSNKELNTRLPETPAYLHNPMMSPTDLHPHLRINCSIKTGRRVKIKGLANQEQHLNGKIGTVLKRYAGENKWSVSIDGKECDFKAENLESLAFSVVQPLQKVTGVVAQPVTEG